MAAFAILLVGDDTNATERWRFYANDLALWMRVLERRMGVARGHMVPLYVNGGAVATSEPTGSFEALPATRAQLAAAYARARAALLPDDPFFFVVSNHGTRPPAPPQILLAPRGQALTPDDLLAEAERLSSRRQVYIFGQCGAERFKSLAGPGRAVLAGCRAQQGTYIRKDDDHGATYQWTEFLYNLAVALGADAEGSAPAPTLREAFASAEQRSTHRKLTEDGSGQFSMIRTT